MDRRKWAGSLQQHTPSQSPAQTPAQTIELSGNYKTRHDGSVSNYLYPLDGKVKKTGSLKTVCDPVARQALILKRGIPVDSEIGKMVQATAKQQCKQARAAGVQQSGVYEVLPQGRLKLFKPRQALDLELLTISIFIYADAESIKRKMVQVRKQPRTNAPTDPVYLVAGRSNSASAFITKDTTLVQIDLMAKKVPSSSLLSSFAGKYHSWLQEQ